MDSDPALRCTIELADTPFTLSAFRPVWERLGGRWTPSARDKYGFDVSFPGDEAPLSVDPLGARILSAWLPILFLDDSDGGESAGGDRTLLDAALARLVERVRSLVGNPALDWRDKDATGYRAVVWTRSQGIVIAHQCALDQEYGDEVRLSTVGIPIADFAPMDSLSVWMRERSRRLHDEHGFPALPD